MTPPPRAPRLPALTLAFALPAAALAPARAAAEPLAVHVPDVEGAPARGRPTHAQWLQLADAVSTALRARLPDVLGAGETANRVNLLDPAQLLCDAPRCASEMAALLHARGVVLVRPALDGHALRLELIAVAPDGSTQASVNGDATVGDWADAVALGRVLGGQLAAAMSAPASQGGAAQGGQGAQPPPNHPPEHHEPPPGANPGGPSVPEAVLGGALLLGGAAAAIAGAVTLASPARCTSAADVCDPPASMNPSPAAEYSAPSDLNWGWVIGGGVAALGGVVLLIDGLRAHGASTAASSARHAPRVAGSLGPTGGAVSVTVSF